MLMGKNHPGSWYDDAIYLAVVPGALGAPIAVAAHTAVFVRETADLAPSKNHAKMYRGFITQRREGELYIDVHCCTFVV